MKKSILLAGLVVIMTGCLTIGNYFSSIPVKDIVIGETTKSDLREMFGQPYQTGFDSGNRSWTYIYISYQVFQPVTQKNLYVIFDEGGMVKSYSFNETTPRDKEKKKEKEEKSDSSSNRRGSRR